MTSTQRATADEPGSAGDEYAVRWFESGDITGILALFEDELDRDWSTSYFERKYVDDPYLAHVPLNVAERDGEIVGVQAYVPVPIRNGDGRRLALQPADAVVRSDHRRNGLYSRLTRQAVDRYTSGEPSLFFNYPNPGALSAQSDLGWRSLGDLDVHYRIQRPSAVLEDACGGFWSQVVGRTADALARGGFGILDRCITSDEEFRVVRHDHVPAETLAGLYERSVPDRLHLCREAQFYEWWLADPAVEPITYVAESDGRPVAALVVRTLPQGVLQIRDALPLGSDRPTAALGALLADVLADNPDVPVVKSVGETLPRSLLGRFGFVGDTSPLVDRWTKPLTMAARPLNDDDSDDAAVDAVTDRANWLPTFLEVDRD